MGTRSLTFVYEGEKPIVNMYRQFDGYPSGHGAELAEFLNGGKLVNGLGNETKVFNGMGCLAAQMVAHFKDGPGGFYLHACNLKQDSWQEYEYHVHEDKVFITEPQQTEVLFEGTWEDFADFCKQGEEA